MLAEEVKRLARECGFDFAGVACAEPAPEFAWFAEWVRRGLAGEMSYLTDRRGEMRADPRTLLPTARSLICVAKRYDEAPAGGPISRYAHGPDYHGVLRTGLERLAHMLEERVGPFDWKAVVDTAPLLERAYARRAGLGWIGKNTCLIREGEGSWFFLGELLISLQLEPDAPPPDRCGTCTCCIDACPTKAIVPTGRAQPAWALDARRCISYLTIELRGPIPEELQAGMGEHVFGCDVCQEVCPWNSAPGSTGGLALEELAALAEQQFEALFRGTAVRRVRYAGFRRNAAIALANRTAKIGS
jgi:epoxyqueuosine reductase